MKPEFTTEDLRLIASLARAEAERNGLRAQILLPGARVQMARRQKDMDRLIRKISLIRRAERKQSFIPF